MKEIYRNFVAGAEAVLNIYPASPFPFQCGFHFPTHAPEKNRSDGEAMIEDWMKIAGDFNQVLKKHGEKKEKRGAV